MGSAGTRLIIDDDLGIREMLAPALSPTSQDPPAGGAAAASETLCTHPFDLTLLNYRPLAPALWAHRSSRPPSISSRLPRLCSSRGYAGARSLRLIRRPVGHPHFRKTGGSG